jgi:hypothetical protein
LSRKLRDLAVSVAEAIERLDKLEEGRSVHVRGLERLLDEQVDPAVAANLRAAGGATMIWDSVMGRLRAVLGNAQELSL